MTKKETDKKIPKSQIIKIIRKYGYRQFRNHKFCRDCYAPMINTDPKVHVDGCLIRKLLEL